MASDRSSHGLEIHHIVHREHGGGHDLSNLVLVCSACHHAHHDGLLEITGTADDLVVRRTNDVRAHGGTKQVRHDEGSRPPLELEITGAALAMRAVPS